MRTSRTHALGGGSRRVALCLLAALCFVVLVTSVSNYWVFVINTCLIASIGALGLNLLTGYAGQVSVGNAAFLALGGYSAVVAAPRVGLIGSIIVGAIVAGVIGLLAGLPALRLRGIYLAISTLALQYIVVFVFQKIQSGAGKISGYSLDYPSLGPLRLDTDLKWSFALFVAVALACWVTFSLVRGRPGRAWVAIREHDVAAAMVGVDVRRYKLLAFILSSMMIGAAGVLRTYYSGHIGYEEFTLDLTVAYVAMIIVGGMASIPGSIIGATLVTGLPFVVQNVATGSFAADSSGFLLTNLSLINTTIYGIIVLLFLMFEPRGLVALLSRAGRGIRNLLAARGRKSAPPPLIPGEPA